jgi:hypothetical protein
MISWGLAATARLRLFPLLSLFLNDRFVGINALIADVSDVVGSGDQHQEVVEASTAKCAWRLRLRLCRSMSRDPAADGTHASVRPRRREFLAAVLRRVCLRAPIPAHSLLVDGQACSGVRAPCRPSLDAYPKPIFEPIWHVHLWVTCVGIYPFEIKCFWRAKTH